MELREKQSKFVKMVAQLIIFAESIGYELTFGDAYRDPRCTYSHVNSLHRHRLAVDFNLFKDGHFLDKSYFHEPLGKYWESIGGAWGGRWGDGNHYSLEHNSMR